MAPPMPWRSSEPIDPDAEYVVTISRLPLRRHTRIPAVMRATAQIVRELGRSEGLVGFSLKADLLSKTFWTMSAWRSERDLYAFVRSAPHRAAMERIGPHMAGPRIETFTLRGAELPLVWDQVQERLTSAEQTAGAATP